MNKNLEEFKRYIKGKRAAVLGIGISNTPLIKYLYNLGVELTAFDRSEEEKLTSVMENFAGMDIKYSLGQDYLKNLKGFDVIFRSPGIRYDLPEITAAVEEGAEITSEMEVFLDLCPAEIFAVTGSDGKTTTTTLIYNILKEQGYKCWLGGNIGIPLLEKIDEVREDDKVVVELSSFQLHTVKKSPDISVVTNLSPNHLDMHKSMEEYIDAKRNIFRYQDEKGKLILNYDNEITKGFANESKGEAIFFSRRKELDKGAFLKDGTLVYKDGDKVTEIVRADEIAIPGVHNIENYLAAISAVINHVKPEAIKKVAASFKGVEHRNELVRDINGIRFFNDSIGSSPTRTIASVSSFTQKVVLIAGGYDKKIPYEEMGKMIVDKVKCLVLMGKTGPKIEDAYRKELEKTGGVVNIPVIKCETIEEAVHSAYNNAVKGDIVILSPASSSFDMFKNFEERGNLYKNIVNGL